MKKPIIKFSHRYEKMPKKIGSAFCSTQIVEIRVKEIKELHGIFIEYDTCKLNGTYYELPKEGKVIIIYMVSTPCNLWTTIRRWTPKKEEYYKSLVGKEVDIEVKS